MRTNKIFLIGCIFLFLFPYWLIPKYFTLKKSDIPSNTKRSDRYRKLNKPGKLLYNFSSIIGALAFLIPILIDIFPLPDTSILTIESYELGVSNVKFSPDSKMLLFDGSYGTIVFHSADTGKHIHKIEAKNSLVNSFDFSPDGEFLIVGTWDNNIDIRFLETGRLLNTIEGHTDEVTCVAYSPDGKTIASGSADKTVRFWSVDTYEEIKRIDGFSDTLYNLEFSPDSKHLAAHVRKGPAFVISTDDYQTLLTINAGKEGVRCFAFQADSSFLATNGYDKKITFWSIETGKKVRTIKTRHRIRKLAFSPDGALMATCEMDDSYNVAIRSVDTGKLIHLLRTSEGYSMPQSAAFSPDGKSFAVSCYG